MKDNIKSIVISRTDNIGDVVLTLPLAGYLKAKIPDVKIYFIGKSYTRPIIQACIFVDEFLDRDEVLLNPNLLSKTQAEAIIFVFPDKDLARLANKLYIPYRIGTSHRWFHWLYLNKKVSFSRKKSTLHEAQLNFKLLQPLGLGNDINLQEIPFFYGLKPNFHELGKLEPYIQTQKFNLIIHPKSKGSAREWGLENYYQLIKSLPEAFFHVFVTGVEAEGQLIKQQKPELFDLPQVTNLTGKLNLNELINFIYLVDGLLACSTGPLHIAAALGKMAVGIYPPIKPMHPERWQPIGENAYCLVKVKDCNKCKNSLKCACIENIEVNQVFKLIYMYAARGSNLKI